MELRSFKTTKQVAQMLECTTRNVSFLVSKGKIKPVLILENGAFIFNVYEIEEFKLKTLKR